MAKAKKDTAYFIKKATQVHGDTYAYNNAEYMGNMKNITITCKIHGDFQQSPSNHYAGKGCRKCANNVQLSFTEYEERAKQKHNNKYSYLAEGYVNALSKITIICPLHGNFVQKAGNHMFGAGCPACGIKAITHNTTTFINKAETIYPNVYDYSITNYINSYTPVCIIRKSDGEIQTVTPHYFLQKPQHIEYRKQYDKEYRQRDIVALYYRIRSRFWCWLNATNMQKTKPTFEYIKLDVQELKASIESQFTEGMTWDNIHIDHHVPLSYFDPRNDFEMQIAWHPFNLRPLFALDNLRKRNTMPDDAFSVIDKIKEDLWQGKQNSHLM